MNQHKKHELNCNTSPSVPFTQGRRSIAAGWITTMRQRVHTVRRNACSSPSARMHWNIMLQHIIISGYGISRDDLLAWEFWEIPTSFVRLRVRFRIFLCFLHVRALFSPSPFTARNGTCASASLATKRETDASCLRLQQRLMHIQTGKNCTEEQIKEKGTALQVHSLWALAGHSCFSTRVQCRVRALMMCFPQRIAWFTPAHIEHYASERVRLKVINCQLFLARPVRPEWRTK